MCRGGRTISSAFRAAAAPARSGGPSPRGWIRRRRGGCSSAADSPAWTPRSTPRRSPTAPRVESETIDGLVNTGLVVDRAQVHHTWHRRLPRGYPTPSHHRDRALDAILPALEARDVYSRGRFGAWKYEVSNQDHSFAQGA